MLNIRRTASSYRPGRRAVRRFACMSLAFTAIFGLVIAPPAQAVTMTEWGTPSVITIPFGIAMGKDGNLWFTELVGGRVGAITTSGTFNFELPVAGSPEGIAPGPDGNLWFTDYGANKIGRITTTGLITEFSVPTASAFDSADGGGIAAGPDGNLWFTETNANKIGRITTSGKVTGEFPIPGGDDPYRITAGPDGNMWFTEFGPFEIGRITTAGTVTQFPIPSPGPTEWTYGITAGPDGNLWFTEPQADIIGRITTSGTVTKFPLPSQFNSEESDITPGPCGDGLWFTEYHNGQIGHITTGGSITEYPTGPTTIGPQGITRGPDGNIWFAGWTTDSLGTSAVGMIGRASDLGLSARIGCLSLLPKVFLPALIGLSQGGTSSWLMQWPGPHGVIDASGMGLFGSQDAIPMGEVYSFTFGAAGTYKYQDPFHPTTKGKVQVPIQVQLLPGTLNQAQIVWASAPPPSGFVYDVQVMGPSGVFKTWLKGVAGTSAVFGPPLSLYKGAGSYQFRARIRNSLNGKASGYSDPGSIVLT